MDPNQWMDRGVTTRGCWAASTPSFPDDLQAVVHDGGPRLAARPAELVWVFDLLVLDSQRVEREAKVGTVRYGNPLPAGWTVLASVWVSYDVGYVVGGRSGRTNAYYSQTVKKEDLEKGPVQPLVSPVRGPLINGRSASVDQAGASASPVLSWKPPLLGQPDGYRVDVFHVYPRPMGSGLRFQRVATLSITEPGVTIPPGVMQAGESYVFDIEAVIERGSRGPAGPGRRRGPGARGLIE